MKVSDLILRTLGFTLGSMNVETIRFRGTFELKLFQMKFLYNSKQRLCKKCDLLIRMNDIEHTHSQREFHLLQI